MRAALTGLGINAVLVAVKLTAGILGHSYALIADAIESSADIASSLIVWGGAADHHPALRRGLSLWVRQGRTPGRRGGLADVDRRGSSGSLSRP